MEDFIAEVHSLWMQYLGECDVTSEEKEHRVLV